MSLSINVDSVTAVLLSDGKWYQVDEESFGFDAYEFYWGDPDRDASWFRSVPREGNSTGFSFVSKGQTYYGPLSSLMAVRESNG